jgi:hypothetical protein
VGGGILYGQDNKKYKKLDGKPEWDVGVSPGDLGPKGR